MSRCQARSRGSIGHVQGLEWLYDPTATTPMPLSAVARCLAPRRGVLGPGLLRARSRLRELVDVAGDRAHALDDDLRNACLRAQAETHADDLRAVLRTDHLGRLDSRPLRHRG